MTLNRQSLFPVLPRNLPAYCALCLSDIVARTDEPCGACLDRADRRQAFEEATR